MDKTDFLYNLKKSLKGKVSILEIDSQIEYYEDFIKGEKEKGISEEEILSDLGDPKLIAKTIFDTYKKNLNQMALNLNSNLILGM